MPIGIGAGTAIAGIVGGGAAITAGAMNAHAAGNAADDQLKANEEALQYQQAKDAYAAQVAETNRRANYDQWAARQGQLSSVGEMLGLPARQVPAYVPLPPGATPAVPGSTSTPPAVVSPGQTPSVTPPPGYASTTAAAMLQPPSPVTSPTATPSASPFQVPMTGYQPGTIGAYLASLQLSKLPGGA